jgi:hypothetical protein
MTLINRSYVYSSTGVMYVLFLSVFKAKCLKYGPLRYGIRQLLSSSSVMTADFTIRRMQQCNTGSKIRDSYTLYVISGLSETVTKKLLCYILCEKILKIHHLVAT